MMHRLRRTWSDLCRSRTGNVAIIFALSVLPLMFAMGMGLDYVSAARRRTKLNAISDAAALSAVTPYMMGQTPAVAKAAATNMFMAQAASFPGLTLNTVAVNVTDSPKGTVTQRTVSVNYAGSMNNVFAKLLNTSSLAIQGSAASYSVTKPNIDFYLLLDTSPSMAIAASQAGINQMVSLTPQQGGCAFACHQTDPADDNLGNPNGWDNYTLARSYSIPLRIDLVAQATQQLTDTAQSTSNVTGAKYRMAIYSFDSTTNNIAPLNSNLSLVKTQASGIQVLTVYKNSWVTATNNDNDTNTNYDLAMSTMNTAMPVPGTGTNNAGDKPQEYLFLVTDGVIDENSNGRYMGPMGGSWCTTLKNRGISIAVLYTTYNPLPTNGFYNSYVSPFQPNIETSLQTCASPGFYWRVDSGGDITGAMNQMFQKAVGSAHLTQ